VIIGRDASHRTTGILPRPNDEGKERDQTIGIRPRPDDEGAGPRSVEGDERRKKKRHS